jgi:DNA-binding transcriptional LysR family regulator
MPLLPAFLVRYPMIRPDWQFENRPVDLIEEGYDAALGGGFDLAPGVVSRPLAPAHLVAVASPAYMAGRKKPGDPRDLEGLDGIVMRSGRTGRVRHRNMRDAAGNEMLARLGENIMVNDPAAMREAAILGLGVTLLAVSDVLASIERGELVRLLPRWYADAGAISIYYATRALLPAKTRVFVDFIVEAFERERLAERFAGSLK